MNNFTPTLTNKNTTMINELEATNTKRPLCQHVKESLENYFDQMDNHTIPNNIYGMVLAEVEKPLLEEVLKRTNNNQSRAAEYLGISRGTLRKKMAIYSLF